MECARCCTFCEIGMKMCVRRRAEEMATMMCVMEKILVMNEKAVVKMKVKEKTVTKNDYRREWEEAASAPEADRPPPPPGRWCHPTRARGVIIAVTGIGVVGIIICRGRGV